MDGLRLYLLGRQLMKIADASFDRSGAASPPLGLMLVLEDIVSHPDSSIKEITARTGFPQSHVSTSVARFRERGVVDTKTDPSDGRRTLVRATPSSVRAAGRRGADSADEAIAGALENPDPASVREVIAALESIAEQLMPNVRAQIARLGDPRPATTKGTKSKQT
jgi:DNA-binding MarR family transcriptional regulator